MTLSLKQRAEEIIFADRSKPGFISLTEEVYKALQEAYQEGRESVVGEAIFAIRSIYTGSKTSLNDYEKAIFALLNPPPKTGKP